MCMPFCNRDVAPTELSAVWDGRKRVLWCISAWMEGIFLKMHITYRTVIWYSRCTFGCNRSLMRNTFLEYLTPSWRCLGFRWKNFPNNSYLSLHVHMLKKMCYCLPIFRIKICYLNSCVTGRLYLYNCSWIFITRTFAVNSVIVVAISHILSVIYWNSNEYSGGTSGCNGGLFLKIHNFHWSHTLHKRCKCGCDR
jgi:hypothetical protein